MGRYQYRVYVIELRKQVFSENAKFRAANLHFNGMLECLYVGMTSKDPKVRFQEHRRGHRNRKGHNLSASIVRKYGTYLRGSLYNHIPPMDSRAEALRMEKELTLKLRRQGYAVWSN
ncbi:MAG: ribose-5-phosphate isomerase [Bacteroidota bacterium]